MVDDEELLLDCLADALSAWGCDVTACAQAEQAIEHLREQAFDLVVSDIRMPGLSGIDLYHWLQTDRPGLAGRILFTTGDSFDPQTREFLDRSRAPHLSKPFDLARLKEALGDLLPVVGEA